MAIYEYKCVNDKCEEYDKVKESSIPIKEYSEDKLPICSSCENKTARNYTPNGHQTFGDSYKS